MPRSSTLDDPVPVSCRGTAVSLGPTPSCAGWGAIFFSAVEGGAVVMKRLALVAIGLACLGGNAMAQDAATVIANAQKALGNPGSITYSGSAKDVSFQQC